jgi:hypothetical protein
MGDLFAQQRARAQRQHEEKMTRLRVDQQTLVDLLPDGGSTQWHPWTPWGATPTSPSLP